MASKISSAFKAVPYPLLHVSRFLRERELFDTENSSIFMTQERKIGTANVVAEYVIRKRKEKKA